MGSASAGIPARPRQDNDVSMKTTRLGANTALAPIVTPVQEAQDSRARISGPRTRAAFRPALVALIGRVGTLLSGRPLEGGDRVRDHAVVIICPMMR
jgi:cation transport ATPase